MDVAVIGGGPAGCACAIELARNGVSVGVFDAAYPGPKPGEVLAPSARANLEAVGCDAKRLTQEHLVCTGIDRIWGTLSIARVDFSNQLTHGWHLDRTTFDTALRERCRAAGARVTGGASLRLVQRTSPGWLLSFDNGVQHAATFLVDASGRGAVVARQLKVKSRVQDRLVAFHLVTPNSDASNAQPMFIEAVENGWWYTTPLPDQRRVFAFLTDSDLPSAHHASKASGFHDLLMKTRVTRHFQTSDIASAPNVYSATSRRLETFGGPGWMAIGDAAISRDPLSGGGMAQALQDGRNAAATIRKGLEGDETSFVGFAAEMQSNWDVYDRERRAMYMTEQRWTWSPFWARRSDKIAMAQGV